MIISLYGLTGGWYLNKCRNCEKSTNLGGEQIRIEEYSFWHQFPFEANSICFFPDTNEFLVNMDQQQILWRSNGPQSFILRQWWLVTSKLLSSQACESKSSFSPERLQSSPVMGAPGKVQRQSSGDFLSSPLAAVEGGQILILWLGEPSILWNLWKTKQASGSGKLTQFTVDTRWQAGWTLDFLLYMGGNCDLSKKKKLTMSIQIKIGSNMLQCTGNVFQAI